MKQLAQGRKLAFNMYVQFHWLGGRVTTRKITQRRLVFIVLMCLNFISHNYFHWRKEKKKFIKIGVLVAKWKQIRSVEKIVLKIEILRPVWFLPIFGILGDSAWTIVHKNSTFTSTEIAVISLIIVRFWWSFLFFLWDLELTESIQKIG